MKSGILIGPLAPLPLGSIQSGSLATIPPASDIHYSFFQLFHIQVFLPPLVWYSDCAREIYICLFCKGSGSRKWSKCWCGPRPRPGKGGEPWCCCGEMFRGREKEASWDYRWERQYVWSVMRGIYQRNAMFFFQRQRSSPLLFFAIWGLHLSTSTWTADLALNWVEIYLHLRDRPLKCLNIDVSLNLFNTPRVWSRFTIFHNITCNSKT